MKALIGLGRRNGSSPLLVLLVPLTLLALPATQAAGSFAAFLPPSDGGGGASAGASVPSGAVPAVNAYPLSHTDGIRLDGRLDDEVWNHAESACRFRMWHPDRGIAPSETTVFKIAYDEDAL
jgi:hypothetical protein